MRKPNCLIFQDGGEWIVFAPLSRLVMRVNRTAADGFREFVDTGMISGGAARGVPSTVPREFAPRHVTIACTNACAQRCVYCYGTPAHHNTSRLDPGLCRAGMELVARQASEQNTTIRVFFHGVGEPTLIWPLFTECVGIVRQVQERFKVPIYISLCTGAQLSGEQARWIARELDEVHVSLDGPADIQNRQRPRADGKDSLSGPLKLLEALREAGKKVIVKSTVTSLSVERMEEVVEFVAETAGPVQLQLNMMFGLPWVRGDTVQPPHWEQFVTGFGRALDRGAELGLNVRHPEISLDTIGQDRQSLVASHFCLAPPNIVTAFYDVPAEGGVDPTLGAYGWYDADRHSIRFDHEKRHRLERNQASVACLDCPCCLACCGPGGVKGRMPRQLRGNREPGCLSRIGVLEQILRRSLTRAGKPKGRNTYHE